MLAESFGAFACELFFACRVLGCGLSRTCRHLEIATAEWVDWFNERRLHGELDQRPPAEVEAAYWEIRQPQLSLPESM
nr:integrase core domain-containing protein [Leucobacter sp. wl10]